MSALFFPHSPARKIGTWFAPGVHVQQHHGEAFRCAADALEAWLCDDPYTCAHAGCAPQECELCAYIHKLGGRVDVCVQCGVQELEPVQVQVHSTGWCQKCDSVVLVPHNHTHRVGTCG